MRVRAIRQCFHIGRRRAGEVFEYEGETLPPWLEEVPPDTPAEVPKPKRTREKPVALSEITKATQANLSDDPKTLGEAGKAAEPDPDMAAFTR